MTRSHNATTRAPATPMSLKSLILPFILLLTAAGFILLRVPATICQPRFWAEEGSIYFAGAWNNGFIEGLTGTYGLGYYAAWANLAATASAYLLPLEWAPAGTMFASLMAQLIPIGIICFSGSEFWRKPSAKILAVAFILFTRLSGEIWLNTITSQFHLSLAAFLLLMEPAADATPQRRWIYRIILLLCGTTGVTSIFLGPIFYYLAFRDKDRERWVQCGILTACAIMQMAIVLSGPMIGNRFSGLSAFTYAAILCTKNLALPFIGISGAQKTAEYLTHIKETQSLGVQNLIGIALLLVIILFWSFWIAQLPRRSRVVFAGGLVLLSGMSFLSMLSPKWDAVSAEAAARYSYATNVIECLCILSCFTFWKEQKTARKTVVLAALFSASAALGGLLDYRATAFISTDCPPWRSEVEIWRRDPNHPLNIWPNWVVHLRQHPPKPEPQNSPAKNGEPSHD